MVNLTNISTKDLIDELAKRNSLPGTGLLNSESNRVVYNQLAIDEMTPIGLSLTLGYPDTMSHDKHACSRCHEKKPNTEFSYYLSRVSADGFLMRSNALCTDCSNKQNNKRSKILNEAHHMGLIPDKPNSGDTCQGCDRKWFGNWHRHHDDNTHQFIAWLCGHCNMSQSDQRGVYGK